MKRALLSMGIAASFVLGLAVVAVAGGKGGHLGLYLEATSTADGGSALEVQSIVPDGPAAKAGVQEGDVLLSIAGEKADTIEALRDVLRTREPGSSVELGVLRGDESITLNVTLGEPPASEAEPVARSEATPSGTGAFLGVGIFPVHPALAAHLGLEPDSGVSVGNVREGSPAAEAGLEAHDVIVSVGDTDVTGPDHFVGLLAERKPGETLSLGVIHRGSRETVEATLAERPSDLPSVGMSPALPFGAPWGPQVGKSGKIILRDPLGRERSFPIPRGSWDVDELIQEMQKDLEESGALPSPGRWSEHFRKLLETYKDGTVNPAWQGIFQEDSSRSSVVRVVEGDLDVTVRDRDGQRTVDVKRGDEVLAEGLPYDKIDTLPENVRQKVEQVAAGIHVESAPAKPLPKLKPLPKSSELKA